MAFRERVRIIFDREAAAVARQRKKEAELEELYGDADRDSFGYPKPAREDEAVDSQSEMVAAQETNALPTWLGRVASAVQTASLELQAAFPEANGPMIGGGIYADQARRPHPEVQRR